MRQKLLCMILAEVTSDSVPFATLVAKVPVAHVFSNWTDTGLQRAPAGDVR